MRPLHELSAVELVSSIKSRAISAKEVILAHLDRIISLESSVKAWAYLNREHAIEQAIKVDNTIASGKDGGLLSGVPVGVKDIFNTNDMPTAMGSPQWEGFTPGNDARVVHYLRMEGAVLPGKTVTAEFAVHAPGKTVNPRNHAYSPGTSSSGSAAAVACNMIPFSLGTQTAGSIMRPASYCGVYGFKPSFGLLPRTGVLKTVDTLDSIGMFARDVLDLRLLFDVMHVRGWNFPFSNAALSDKHRQKKGDRPWRIALIPSWTKHLSRPYAWQSFQDLVNRLSKDSNIELIEKDLPPEFENIHDIHDVIYKKSLSYYFQREFKNTKFISQIIYEMISAGQKISIEEYYEALDKQADIAAKADKYFDNCDAILTLTTQGVAPKINEEDLKDTCLIWTFCWLPAISLPVFTGPDKMPFGAQCIGRRYNDYLLLDFAQLLSNYIDTEPLSTYRVKRR